MTTHVIAGRYVLGMRDGAQTLLENHYVYVDGNIIEAVTKDPPAATQSVLRYDNGLVTPGFVNLHSHCIKGALFRGIPDDQPFAPWMPQLIYKILLPLGKIATDVLTKEDLRAVMALGLVDILKGGSTTVMDMWNHGQEIFFDVAREIGIRVVGAPYLMSTSKLGVDSNGKPIYEFGNDGLASLAKAIETFHKFDEGHDGTIQVALGPHGADTCLPDLLQETRKAADELGCIITTHLAQTPEELVFLNDRYGIGPVEYLGRAGILGDDVVLAHCVFLSDEEVGELQRTGTSVANCVISFARDGTNVPYARFAEAGVRTGIGTDSHGMNYISEMRTAGFYSKHYFKSAEVATAYQLMQAGTLIGADALKRPDLGRLTAGAKADILVFDLFQPHLQPVWDPVKNLIWKGSAADIALIMVHGRIVVMDRKLMTADEPAIMRAASKAARKIWEIAADRGILPLPTMA